MNNLFATSDIVQEKLKNGKVMKEYMIGKFLGKGGFAKCYEFKELSTEKVFAAKIISKCTLTKRHSKQKLISEINIHKSLNHSRVVKFESSFEDTQNIYIILELCPNKTLKELLRRRKKLTEMEAQCYLGQIIPTLEYLHNNNIIHRDIKLGNLFLGKDMEVKIGDFGLAAKLLTRHERRHTMCGTPNYVAPEILSESRAGKPGHSFEVDIWGLGIVLYILLVGKPPFEGANVKTTYKKINYGKFTIPTEVNLSLEAKNLIKKILVINPEERPTLRAILEDPFMKHPYPENMSLHTLDWIAEFKVARRKLPKDLVTSCKCVIGNEVENIEKTKSLLNSSGNLKLKENHEIVLIHKANHNYMVKGETLTSKITQAVTPYKNSVAVRNWQNLSELTFVDFYADYSDRYGVGYVLTNGITGFFYNDVTNFLLMENKSQYSYWKGYNKKGNTESIQYKFTEYPKELDKKIKILLYFNQWYNTNKKVNVELNDTERCDKGYVRKMIKTNNGILFKLENRIIQMCFKDGSQLVVSFKNKLILYITKSKERQTYKLSHDLLRTENVRVLKRFKYVVNLMNTLNPLFSSGIFSLKHIRPNCIEARK